MPQNPDITTIRRLLLEDFDDSGLDAFCQDRFPEVYRIFGRGMRKDEKVSILLEHAHRCGDIASLPTIVKRYRQEFDKSGSLSGTSTEAVASPMGAYGAYCAICGQYVILPQSFQCKGCGRNLLCLKHQEAETGLCPQCAKEGNSQILQVRPLTQKNLLIATQTRRTVTSRTWTRKTVASRVYARFCREVRELLPLQILSYISYRVAVKGVCIRCRGEYDRDTKRCTRCGADNAVYEILIAQGFSRHLIARLFVWFLPLAILFGIWIILAIAGFLISDKVILMLSAVYLIIWSLVTTPAFASWYSAVLMFWEREHLRHLDFLAERPLGISSRVTRMLLITLFLLAALGGMLVFNMVSSYAPSLEYTAFIVTLTFFFSFASSAFCFSLIIAIEVRRLVSLLPSPIFEDSWALQNLVINGFTETLKLKPSDSVLSIAEIKRSNTAGIGLIVIWTKKEFVVDEHGERKIVTKGQRFRVEADRWGRLIMIEELKGYDAAINRGGL